MKNDMPNRFKEVPKKEVREWLEHPATKALEKAIQKEKSDAAGRVLGMAADVNPNFTSPIVSQGARHWAMHDVLDIFQEASDHVER